MDPGKLEIRVRCAAGRIAALTVASSRPEAARVLHGRSAAQAVTMVPQLFALCGRAQGVAAMAARAAIEEEAFAARHDAGVAAEAAQEHLWRLLCAWPRELDLAPQDADFGRWRRILAADPSALVGPDLRDFLAQRLLGMAPGAWLELSRAEEFEAWCRNSPAPAAQLCRTLEGNGDSWNEPRPVVHLPALDATMVADDWPVLSAAFALRPQWRGRPSETGAYARRHEDPLLAALATRPLLARLVARLQELAALTRGDFALPLPGAVMAFPLDKGRGRALVETARGLLMHELTLLDGRVADYVIVAPTEWNFHPDGALPALLAGRACASEPQAATLVRRTVLALDPCVAHEINIDWQAPP
ncbi:MAG TPA: nickel-dependent hydrogenase large subunit [Rhodocyclaceae bacterium]|nr:nickel-dependent hydrogenase large subunit [Rhodocyclaceae bacterium]